MSVLVVVVLGLPPTCVPAAVGWTDAFEIVLSGPLVPARNDKYSSPLAAIKQNTMAIKIPTDGGMVVALLVSFACVEGLVGASAARARVRPRL